MPHSWALELEPARFYLEDALNKMSSGRMGVLVILLLVSFSIALTAAGGIPIVALSPTPLGCCDEDE